MVETESEGGLCVLWDGAVLEAVSEVSCRAGRE
jgi:hypothetical protein